MTSTHVLLSVENLKKYYPLQENALFRRKNAVVRAVENVSFQVQAGETFALVGESGSGKSTLGRATIQLIKPTQGKVFFQGEKDGERIELTSLSTKQMRPLRKDMQIIFQDPYSSLNPKMTVGRILEEGVLTHKFYPKKSKEMREYLSQVLEDCGLQAYMQNRYPHEFSGGQRQRICIARALALKPKFIVCDECVSALDVSVQSQILNLLGDLKEREGLTYLFISHDLSVVRYISDRIGVMYLGRIVEQGEADTVFDTPLHPYTIALISAIPTLTGEKNTQILLEGHMPSPVSPPQGCPFHTRCFMAKEVCQRVPAPIVEVETGHFVACHFADVPTEEKRRMAGKR